MSPERVDARRDGRMPEGGRVLLTGASGNLGRVLVSGLGSAGFRLRLTDLVPFPDSLPDGAAFAAADLSDASALASICPEDVTDIVHFGGINTETSSEAILKANIHGTLNVFELARLRGARVVFASSNHTIGFYPRDRALTIDDPYRPDGFYGLSKAYVELLGRLYFDKHGVESVHLRIGSCLPEPLDTRHLATWLSYPDLVRLVSAALTAPAPGYAIVWGISRNARRWWDGDDARRIGYCPEDDAERFAERVAPEEGDAAALAHQGAAHCAMGYSRRDDV
ncbi:MAG: NAD(P)-dependent oxidoreductase [Microvirga sp.]